MAREFARSFYHSSAWKNTRDAYIRAHSLCERCLQRNEVTPGAIVHHIQHLSPDNINDSSITLSWENLETVCRDCHAKEHPEIYGKEELDEPARVGFDENGNLVNLEGLRL